MGIKNVSADSFDTDVLKSDVPVLVDFWAEWCGPCKLIAPILDEVSHDYADRMAVAKVNVDESQAIAAKYGIRGIPTLMLFKNGTLVGTKVGAVSKGQLTAFLDSNLTPGAGSAVPTRCVGPAGQPCSRVALVPPLRTKLPVCPGRAAGGLIALRRSV